LDVDAQQVRQINNIPKGMRIKAGSTVLIPRGGKVGEVAEHLANNVGKLMLEREVVAKPKTTAKNASGLKAKKSGNKQSANKQAANNTNKAKPKPKSQADTKVAANEKKAN
jgi:membrane-bound lytic murein transglycosylase D